MLTKIRESVMGWKAVVVLVVLSASFVFFGVNMSFSGGSYFAKVNGEEISTFEVQELYTAQSNQFRQQFGELTPDLDRIVQQNVVQQLITNKVVETYLDDERIVVTDNAVIDAISNEPSFQQDGKFSAALYREQLALSGRFPAEFERDMAKSLRFGQLQRGIEGSAFITPSALRQFIELSAEQRTFEFGLLPISAFAVDEAPDEAAIQTFYDENQLSFQTADSATLSYLELSQTAVADTLTVTDEALGLWYEGNKASFETPPERNPRHILIPVEDDESAAQALATEIYNRIQAGEDFAALAGEFSKDGGSAELGGDLGWVREGQFVGSVDDAVFAMTEGELRGPVRSEFGFHVLRLDGIRSGGIPPLDEVRADVERDYRQAEAANRYDDIRDELADALFDNPDLEVLAESQGLALKSVEAFTRSTAGIFLNDDAVLDVVFGDNAIRDGALSDILTLADGRTLVMRVDEYRPAETRQLADVREDIIAELNRQRSEEALTAAAAALVSGEYADSAAFEAAVIEAGGTFSSATTAGRTATTPSAALVADVFAQSRHEALPRSASVAIETGDRYVYRLQAIDAGDATAISEAERAALRAQLASRQGSSDLQAMVTQLTEDASIKMGAAELQSANDF